MLSYLLSLKYHGGIGKRIHVSASSLENGHEYEWLDERERERGKRTATRGVA